MRRSSYWEQVVAEGYRLPRDEALDELTTELVTMLGEPDPHVREDIAYSVLQVWIAEGVYDHLLSGLGDGLAAALRDAGASTSTSTSESDRGALLRSYSALTLTAVVARDNVVRTLSPTTVLTWADHAVGWFLAERDLRTWARDLGWIRAVTHGADLIGALSASRHIGTDELTVLLDVVAERLLTPTDERFDADTCERLAFATMSLLHRDLVGTDALETWLDRITQAPAGTRVPTGTRTSSETVEGRSPDETSSHANVTGYLKALHLQLLLGVHGTPAQDAAATPSATPAARSDLLIALQHALRSGSPWLYRQPTAAMAPAGR